MPILIQNITGKIADNISDDVAILKTIQTDFGYTDWFKIGSLEVFLQNFKKVVSSENLYKSSDFGLSVNRDKIYKEIEISY
jgi:hypothetical protein